MNEKQRFSFVNFLSFVLACLLAVASDLVNKFIFFVLHHMDDIIIQNPESAYLVAVCLSDNPKKKKK